MPNWKSDGGVYLGQQVADPADKDEPLKGDWPVSGGEHRYTRDAHIFTVGPNGSGKTMRVLLPNLYYLQNWSILVVDPKGDLAAHSHLHRRATGSEIITLDPFGVLAERFPRLVEQYPDLRNRPINPIGALDPASSDFPDDAKKIGEAIIKVEGKEPHWPQAARALVTGVAMALRVQEPTKANFKNLRTIISFEPENLAHFIVTRFLAGLPEGMEAISAKLNRFTRFSDENRELDSVLATAITQTDWLDSGPIQRSLEGGAYDFGQMKERPITVYLVLPPRYLETHATWLRLMITTVLMPLIRTPGGKVPVLFMLDECAQLGRLEVIEQNMALMRGYGVKLWPVFQDFAQVRDVYERRWESFISNAGVIQSFAPQDRTTRDYLSYLSGQKTYWVDVKSHGRNQTYGRDFSQGTSSQNSMQRVQEPVWSAQDLAKMADGQGILFSKGKGARGAFPFPTDLPGVSAMVKAAEAAAGSDAPPPRRF